MRDDRVEGVSQLGGAGQAVLDDLAAAVCERGRGAPDGLAAGPTDRLQPVLLEDRDALDRGRWQASLGDRREHQVEVLGETRERPDGSEHLHAGGRRPGRVRRARHRAAARSQPVDARPVRGGADRAREVAANAERAHGGGHRRGLSARGAAGSARTVMRVARRPVDVVDGVPECAELGQVGLAQQNRACTPQAPYDHRIGARDPVGLQARAVRRRQARDVDDFLDRERHAVQRAERVAARGRVIRRGGLRPCGLQARHDDGVHVAVAGFVAGRVGVEQFRAADLARTHGARHPRRGALDELAHGCSIGHAAADVTPAARASARGSHT